MRINEKPVLSSDGGIYLLLFIISARATFITEYKPIRKHKMIKHGLSLR